MPGLEEVEAYVHGIYLLARNRPEGFKWLDISADGFWRSFWAIVYAAPALAVSWASYRTLFLQASGDGVMAGPGFVLRLALVDAITWIAPLVLVGIAARPLGIERNFGRFVIATNWLGTVTSYAMAVPAVLRMISAGLSPVVALASLAVFVGSILLLYRVTRLSLDGDGMTAAVVTIATFVLSFAATGILQQVFGIAMP